MEVAAKARVTGQLCAAAGGLRELAAMIGIGMHNRR